MTIHESPLRGAHLPIDEALVRLVDAMGAVPRTDTRQSAVSEATYRQFVEALGVALYTTDVNGRITYFNEPAVAFWGRRPELGEEWCGSWRLFWPNGRPMLHAECPMAIALSEDRVVRGAEAIAERPDGSRVHFEPYPTPLHDPDGRLVGGVNVLVDITERRRVEAELRDTVERLAESHAAKDTFLGLVSHELRTPVTTIFGNASILLGRADRLPSPEREMIADIAEEADRLSEVVENLLLLSRLEAGTRVFLEPILLARHVQRQVGVFAERHGDREIVFAAGGTEHIVEADPTYIAMLVQNLCGNAVKYSDASTPIEVDIQDVGDEVEVRVLDRGMGIVGDPASLFTAFYRSEAAQKVAGGLGLGLPVCRRLVEALGGRVWGKAREGGGSEFGFALPTIVGDEGVG